MSSGAPPAEVQADGEGVTEKFTLRLIAEPAKKEGRENRAPR